MADHVTRDVAIDRLRRTCKGGTIVSVFVLLLGLCYAAAAAIIGSGINMPFEIMYTTLRLFVPSMDDAVLGLGEAACKAVLLLLMGIFGLLLCRGVSKSGEAFRLRSLRQFKFVALLSLLLGFLPTVVADVAKIIVSLRSGEPALAVLSFAVEPMCILMGLVMFMLARVLVAGGVCQEHADDYDTDMAPDVSQPMPAGVPDLSSRIPEVADLPSVASEPVTTVPPTVSTAAPVLEEPFDPFTDDALAEEVDATIIES